MWLFRKEYNDLQYMDVKHPFRNWIYLA